MDLELPTRPHNARSRITSQGSGSQRTGHTCVGQRERVSFAGDEDELDSVTIPVSR